MERGNVFQTVPPETECRCRNVPYSLNSNVLCNFMVPDALQSMAWLRMTVDVRYWAGVVLPAKRFVTSTLTVSGIQARAVHICLRLRARLRQRQDQLVAQQRANRQQANLPQIFQPAYPLKSHRAPQHSALP